jgi:hypothetical protein
MRSLDEVGRWMVSSLTAAPYVRTLAYLKHHLRGSGCPERLIAAYASSRLTRARIDAWFALFGPRAVRFPAPWLSQPLLVRLLRRSIGALARLRSGLRGRGSVEAKPAERERLGGAAALGERDRAAAREGGRLDGAVRAVREGQRVQGNARGHFEDAQLVLAPDGETAALRVEGEALRPGRDVERQEGHAQIVGRQEHDVLARGVADRVGERIAPR